MANAHHSKAKYIQIANKLRGQKRSDETRKKMSEALMGHKHSPETLAKLRGRKVNSEGRKRMSDAMKGRIPWNKGKKIGNKCSGGWFKKGHKRSPLAGMKKGRVWSAEEREANRQGQYRRFEREIPNYHYEDNGRRIRRKVRLLENGGHHTKQQWEFLKGAYNYTCKMCNRKEPEIKLTKDHIIAIRHGGNNDIQNIQPLCRSCNSKKH